MWSLSEEFSWARKLWFYLYFFKKSIIIITIFIIVNYMYKVLVKNFNGRNFVFSNNLIPLLMTFLEFLLSIVLSCKRLSR